MEGTTTVQTPQAPVQGEPSQQAQSQPTTQTTPQTAPPKEAQSTIVETLARERQRTLRMQRQMKAKEQSWEKEKQEWLTKLQSFEQASNPIAALQAKGYTYEDATNFVLNDNKPTVEQQLKALEEKVNGKFKTQEQLATEREEKEKIARQKQDQAMIQEAYESTLSFVTDNAEKYELINLHNQQDTVWQTIMAHFGETGEIPDTAKVCDVLESYLETQIDAAVKSKKLSGRYKSLEEKKAEAAQQSSGGGSKTLTNDMIPSSAMASTLPAATEQDRIRRALAKL